jgi:hypothetical protein
LRKDPDHTSAEEEQYTESGKADEEVAQKFVNSQLAKTFTTWSKFRSL